MVSAFVELYILLAEKWYKSWSAQTNKNVEYWACKATCDSHFTEAFLGHRNIGIHVSQAVADGKQSHTEEWPWQAKDETNDPKEVDNEIGGPRNPHNRHYKTEDGHNEHDGWRCLRFLRAELKVNRYDDAW